MLGKASLILTSEEFEGKLLNVGLKSDLTRTLNGTKNVPTKKPKLMVPPTLQRRVRKK